jgi:hypothetical protein
VRTSPADFPIIIPKPICGEDKEIAAAFDRMTDRLMKFIYNEAALR